MRWERHSNIWIFWNILEFIEIFWILYQFLELFLNFNHPKKSTIPQLTLQAHFLILSPVNKRVRDVIKSGLLRESWERSSKPNEGDERSSARGEPNWVIVKSNSFNWIHGTQYRRCELAYSIYAPSHSGIWANAFTYGPNFVRPAAWSSSFALRSH